MPLAFTPSRLTLARKRRGLKKTELATRIDRSTRSITDYENGSAPPSDATLADLAKSLRFPASFFAAPPVEIPEPDDVSFRALSRTSAGRRDSALGAGGLAIILSEWIQARFNLPAPDLPDLRQYKPEQAADAVRARWGLGECPVGNLVHLLESRGVRIFSLIEECKEVDAFSMWKDDVPFIFLNTSSSGERGRFDAAHELAHLLLHRHGRPNGREAETEADSFASAFLMPRGSVTAMAPRVPSLANLIGRKKTWNVSVAALAHRLHALHLMGDWHYRTVCIEINARGYRHFEPEGMPRETSQALQTVFRLLGREQQSPVDVARELHIYPEDLDAIVFGLVPTVRPGGRSVDRPAEPRSSDHLRLVEGERRQ